MDGSMVVMSVVYAYVTILSYSPYKCLHCTHLHARNERTLLFLVQTTGGSRVTVLYVRCIIGGECSGYLKVYDVICMYVCIEIFAC